MKKTILIFLTAVILILIINSQIGFSKKITNYYTDPAQFTSIPFGFHSHWLQPWRAYLETVPATTFLNGTGINWNINKSVNPELVAQMLAKYGIRRSRVEIGWVNIDWDDETKINNATQFQNTLLTLKKYGIRPLILLNAHHGVPCPVKFYERTLITDARVGDTQIQLDDISGLRVGYSGVSNLTDYWAAELLITKISGNTITLSKPLPKNIEAGTPVTMATLKYRPFSVPGSNDYEMTMAGWERYVETVAEFVTEVLATTQSDDKGFDMEIWNELSFGSYFLYVNSYYAQKPYDYNEDSIWGNLVKETATFVSDRPADFQGVFFSDGLANTIPWPASSTNPARITAISKHPYFGRKHYPQDEQNSTPINALAQKDTSSFIPTYSVLFPEYFATALQTETIIRDMGPITSEIYGTKHGRYARAINGVVVPNPIWITEANLGPNEHDRNITPERAFVIKAKTNARYFCFYLNKGVTQVHLFAVEGGDKGLGIVKQSFLDYAEQPNATYPTDDRPYTSLVLATLGRIVSKMSEQLDRNLTKTRQIEVVSIRDTHDRYQFAGDGTPAHPNLYDRDVFAFLPFQVNARKFVIPYYVMTRDIMKDLPPEEFTVQIKGIKGNGASVTAYDPMYDQTVPVAIDKGGQNSLSVKLTATDYPYLLIIESGQYNR